MSIFKKIFLPIFLCIVLIGASLPNQSVSAAESNPFPFILLTKYSSTMDIGDELYIMAITSNLKQPTWKSSNSKIASVNTYGIVTAKKAGSALITAKIKNAEASCYITVKKTQVSISYSTAYIQRGQTFKLSASTSNGSTVTWKSAKKSIATVDEYGMVTGLKPGVTQIIATADGSSATCNFTVLSPTVKLNSTSVSLYRGQTLILTANVSSKIPPVWKTNKKSVAVVNKTGTITAIKHGSAIISATVDGVTAECSITVLQPKITLSKSELTIKKGGTATITATISSNNLPSWSTSNSNILSINSKGEIKALQKGKAYIYATEDGTKARCTIYVTD